MTCHAHRFAIPLIAAVLTALTGQGADRDYTDKDLPDAKFVSELLNRAKFDRANLEGADFSYATLKNASFKGANLERARFRHALLEGADFSGAKLKGALFTSANASKANFSGTEIHLLRATRDDTNGTLSFQYSNLRDAVVVGDADGVDFRWADLRGADFKGAKNLDMARFKGAQFDEATKWDLDTEKAGAIRVKREVAKKVDEPKTTDLKLGKDDPANSPFVGTWSIYRDIADPATGGELKIAADRTCVWKPLTSDAKVLSGKWSSTNENQLAIEGGELGKTWNVRRVVRANGKAYLELKTVDGETRLALPR